jgi:hypothetical protein
LTTCGARIESKCQAGRGHETKLEMSANFTNGISDWSLVKAALAVFVLGVAAPCRSLALPTPTVAMSLDDVGSFHQTTPGTLTQTGTRANGGYLTATATASFVNPSVTASVVQTKTGPDGGPQGGADSQMTYYFEVVYTGGGASPPDAAVNLVASGGGTLSTLSGSEDERLTLSGNTVSLTFFSGIANGVTFPNGASFSVNTNIMVPVGAQIEVTISAGAGLTTGDSDSATAFLDPLFTSVSPDFTIEFSSGISQTAPPLNIEQSGGVATVYWLNVPGWNLEQTTNLAIPNSWTTNNTATTIGGTNYLNIPAPTGNLFFRLAQK